VLALRVVALLSTVRGPAPDVVDVDEERTIRSCETYMPARSSFPHLERPLEMQGRCESVLPVQRRC
jgi:hypothetical protein